MSPKAAGLAVKWGYSKVMVFNEGEPEWKKRGYYTVSTAYYIKKSNIVLIDLRESSAVKEGHIPGAVGIPASDLDSAKDTFPSFKGAHIVFYSDNINDMQEGLKKSRSWGYNNSTIFTGGTAAWKSAGFDIKTGPAAAKITYERKLDPGEISIADFEKALTSSNAVVVDVRSAMEHDEGHFKGSVNMSVNKLAKDYTKLPKDKKIITYCESGVRAEMAYDILNKLGYDTSYLKAKPKFAADGSYTISE